MLRPYAKYRGLYCGLRRWIQKLQERADALGPRGFIVLCAFDTLVGEIFAELPTFLKEDVAKLFNIGDDAGTFFGADVKPDSRAGFDRSSGGEAMDHTLIPPYRWRERCEPTEDLRMFQSKIEGQQSAQR